MDTKTFADIVGMKVPALLQIYHHKRNVFGVTPLSGGGKGHRLVWPEKENLLKIVNDFKEKEIAKKEEAKERREQIRVSLKEEMSGAIAAIRIECGKKYNPKPKGEIQRGSTTDRVLRYMQDRRDMKLTPSELIKSLHSSHSAISWALRFLEANGHICSFDHPDRVIYRVYQAV